MVRKSLAAIVAASFVAGMALPASAQQQAGVSAAVRGQVALARATQNIVGQQVESGDPIFLGDAITSGRNSGMQVMLLDETVFSIGPNSEISIDEFVYDPATSAGKVTASVAKGVFRFITGKIARQRPEDMTVRLPTATIGIRGTIVAGAVREAVGRDAQVDAVFDGLKGLIPNVKEARDFAVLLGPGDENNTNDKGGAFVYTPSPGTRAVRGASAGASLLAQLLPGGGPGGSTTVSRTGYGVASDPGGNVFGPFPTPPAVTQGMTGGQGIGAQPAEGAKGKATDSNAQEANNPGDPQNLSGNNIAETTGIAAPPPPPTPTPVPTEEIGGGSSPFSFAQLIAIPSGTALASGNSISFTNGFSASNSLFEFNFGTNKFQFDMQGLANSAVSLSGGQIGCFSSCSIDYGDQTGAANFSADLISSQANFSRNSNCVSANCSTSITVQNASSSSGAQIVVNISAGGASGSAEVSVPAN